MQANNKRRGKVSHHILLFLGISRDADNVFNALRSIINIL